MPFSTVIITQFSIENENNDKIIDLYNRYFFMAKIYLWTSRCEDTKPSLLHFINFLYDEMYYELCIFKSKYKDFTKRITERWSDLIHVSNILYREFI
jgi:hypothetical protein